MKQIIIYVLVIGLVVLAGIMIFNPSILGVGSGDTKTLGPMTEESVKAINKLHDLKKDSVLVREVIPSDLPVASGCNVDNLPVTVTYQFDAVGYHDMESWRVFVPFSIYFDEIHLGIDQVSYLGVSQQNIIDDVFGAGGICNAFLTHRDPISYEADGDGVFNIVDEEGILVKTYGPQTFYKQFYYKMPDNNCDNVIDDHHIKLWVCCYQKNDDKFIIDLLNDPRCGMQPVSVP